MGLTWVSIPARVQDNPALLEADPRYIDRLKSSGSPQRVRAWLEGDWNVIEGAFFSEFYGTSRHHAVHGSGALDEISFDGLGFRIALRRALAGGRSGQLRTRWLHHSARRTRRLQGVVRSKLHRTSA